MKKLVLLATFIVALFVCCSAQSDKTTIGVWSSGNKEIDSRVFSAFFDMNEYKLIDKATIDKTKELVVQENKSKASSTDEDLIYKVGEILQMKYIVYVSINNKGTIVEVAKEGIKKVESQSDIVKETIFEFEIKAFNISEKYIQFFTLESGTMSEVECLITEWVNEEWVTNHEQTLVKAFKVVKVDQSEKSKDKVYVIDGGTKDGLTVGCVLEVNLTETLGSETRYIYKGTLLVESVDGLNFATCSKLELDKKFDLEGPDVAISLLSNCEGQIEIMKRKQLVKDYKDRQKFIGKVKKVGFGALLVGGGAAYLILSN